jgi:hypothetical protein
VRFGRLLGNAVPGRAIASKGREHENESVQGDRLLSHGIRSEERPPSAGGLSAGKSVSYSGVGEIRTHEGLSPLAVFKTAAFNHSATTPGSYNVFSCNGLFKSPVKEHEAAGAFRCPQGVVLGGG